MSAIDDATKAIAEFQHRNESMHRHPVDGDTCNYCNLVGHYAVRTLVNNPELLAALVIEAGVAEVSCYDPPDDFEPDIDDPKDWDRSGVYYEDEDRPEGCVPLYRLTGGTKAEVTA